MKKTFEKKNIGDAEPAQDTRKLKVQIRFAGVEYYFHVGFSPPYTTYQDKIHFLKNPKNNWRYCKRKKKTTAIVKWSNSREYGKSSTGTCTFVSEGASKYHWVATVHELNVGLRNLERRTLFNRKAKRHRYLYELMDKLLFSETSMKCKRSSYVEQRFINY